VWQATDLTAEKGVVHAPADRPAIAPDTRDALLEAIAKARAWIDDLVTGQANSLTEIAQREGKVERHILYLAPLAFVSPRLVSAIIEGSVPAGLTVTELASALSHSWFGQLDCRPPLINFS
jgi:hypothetical protein